MEQVKGRVHSVETFGLVDGPGVRYILFLQGCRMRCKYCHNPETWDLNAGEEKTAQEAFAHAVRYKNYWGKNGGITVSGGEPLLQIDFVIEFFKLAKQKGIHTTIDTAGNPFTMDDPEWLAKFDQLMEVTDLFMLDIKQMDEEAHKDLTKWGNQNILQMAKYLSDHGKEMWIRRVLVPGVTDDDDELQKLADFIKELKTVSRVEVLPYHTLGLFKWENIGVEYPLEGVRTPEADEVKHAEDIIIPEELRNKENAQCFTSVIRGSALIQNRYPCLEYSGKGILITRTFYTQIL